MYTFCGNEKISQGMNIVETNMRVQLNVVLICKLSLYLHIEMLEFYIELERRLWTIDVDYMICRKERGREKERQGDREREIDTYHVK